MMLLHIPSVYDSPCAALQASFELAGLFRDVLGMWGFSFEVETSSSALIGNSPIICVSLTGRDLFLMVPGGPRSANNAAKVCRIFSTLV